MPFNSLSYLLFLPGVFLLHYFTPDKFRWLLLLIASFFFYATIKAPHLIVVLLIITTITYFTGICIDREESPRNKKYFLWGGISANILTLIILKYLPFLTQNLNIFLIRILHSTTTVSANKTIIVIGASYYIFQAISYLIDIYLEIEKPERHFGLFALYMSFFPKLLQGPIERVGYLLPQLKIPYVFNYDNVRSGMLLFAIGLLKKVVIADRLAFIVNPVFDNVHNYSGLPLIIACYAYSLQIYYDFSGYTDMALGTALIFNITLTQNFNNPYFAPSIADFWRRWHISFSRWILDYIFKPLQLSWRNWGNWGLASALMITFTISGLWHGTGLGFLIWGILHGVYMTASICIIPYRLKLTKRLGSINLLAFNCLNCFITFSLVSIAWVFFRANSVYDAVYILNNLLVFSNEVSLSLLLLKQKVYQGNFTVLYTITLLMTMYIISFIRPVYNLAQSGNIVARWFIYIVLGYLILVTGVFSDDPSFIYFRF